MSTADIALQADLTHNNSGGIRTRGAALLPFEASEAYAVLSDYDKRHLYDVLGPDKYDDPREIFRYQQQREAAMRDMRNYKAYRSAHREEVAETMGYLVFFLILLNLIP